MRCTHCGRLKGSDNFAGEGGAGEGYFRAGFCMDAIDTSAERLKHYPNRCPGSRKIRTDAVAFILELGHIYAFNHASPTCTGYSRGTAAIPDRFSRYDRLIAATREALEYSGRPYVIENVEDAKRELIAPVRLCWTEFFLPGTITDGDGTPLMMRRHRLFESNLPLMGAGGCRHKRVEAVQVAGAYGGARRDKVEAREIRKGGYVPAHGVMRRLLGTEWMTEKGCQLSIPPAYTHFLGEQIMEQIR